MELTQRQWALLALSLVAVGVAAAATSTTPISDNNDGVVLNQTDGPTATLTGDTSLKNTSGGVDSDTIQFNTTDGSARFTASGTANVTVAVSDLEGTWTNATGVEASKNNITINPSDKPKLTARGSVDSVAFRSMTIDDSTVDFTYTASGAGTVTVTGIAGNTEVGAVTGTGKVLDSDTSSQSGEASFAVTSGTYNVRLLTSDGGPTASDIFPPEGYETNQEDVLFNLTVDDPDFPDDNVTATLYRKGPTESSFGQVHTANIGNTGEISTTKSLPIGGEHDYYWNLTDGYGKTTQTSTRTITVPDELRLYEINNPDTLISSAGNTDTVNVTFSSTDNVFERSTPNSRINLTGLPVTDTITASTSVNGYYDAQVVIRSIFEQQAIYLLNDTVPAYQTRFQLVDNIGGTFGENDPSIDVQRALNKSGSTKWVTVRGGLFGVQGYTTDLEQGEEYRLVVRNDIGDSRVFYPYTAAGAETVPLEIGKLDATTAGGESYTVETYYDNSSKTVELELVDDANQTDTIWIEIYERNNESNKLLQNTSFTGPYGNLSVTEQVPTQYNSSEWVVEYYIDRGDTSDSGRDIVGPRISVLQLLPVWLRTLMSVGTILVTAGLFSRLNGAVGGLVCAGMAGMFWYVSFVPPGVGVGVVILSMVTAGMLFIRGGRV